MPRGKLLRASLALAFYENTQQWQFVLISLGLPLAVYLLLLLLQHLWVNVWHNDSIAFVAPRSQRAAKTE
jgi:hypothetical protein